MGLENQSLPAVSKSRYKDTYTPLLCVRFPLKEREREEIGDARDKVTVYQTEEKSGKSYKTNAWDTTDAQPPEQKRWESDKASAGGGRRPAEHGTQQAFTCHPWG